MKNTKPKKKKFIKFVIISVILCGIGLMLGAGVAAYVLRDRINLKRPKEEYIRYARNMVSQIKWKAIDKLSFRKGRDDKEDEKFTGILSLAVHPKRKIREINPMIYGANLDTKTEFEMDVAKFAEDTGITSFRFPGGGSSGYRWKLGTFDFSDRFDNAPLSEIKNVIKFSKIVGVNIIIMVNIESGTPQEAADWVRFMNQSSEGMRVDYWELGNEVYGDWDTAYMPGQEYAKIIKAYSQAMKQADPTIKIGANWGGPRYSVFDEAIMKEAADYFDFLSFHWYPNHVDQYHKYKGRFHPLPKEIMANSMAVGEIVDRVTRMIDEYAPHRKGKIKIAFLEWDGSWDAVPSDLEFEYKGMMWSLANGIFYADTLGHYARHGILMAHQFCFQEVMFGLIRGWDKEAGWGGSRWDGKTIRPKALALKLFARHFGDILIESKMKGSPNYDKKRDWRADSYTGEVPYVEAYASTFSQERKIAIVLTNKHASQNFKVNISLEGVNPQDTGYVWILNGPDLEAQNDGSPGTVDIKKYDLSGVKKKFTYDIPAHSVNLLEIRFTEPSQSN
ncbi:MAG: hypothetical protein KAS66_04780 [Candidatus Omnitrophica bacterium]|nr:hypothetical protein [Candidatus Omnitrophota bacterium]